MSSERADVHASGVLNREKARDVATGIARGEYDTAEDAVDALEGCVVPDPRWVEVDDLNDFRQPDRTGRALVEYDGPNIVHVYVPVDQ